MSEDVRPKVLSSEELEPKSWWRSRSRGFRIGATVFGSFATLLLVAWISLPYIVASVLRSKLPEIEERLGRKVDFKDVEVHGLTGLDIHGIEIEDDAGNTLLTIERVELRLSSFPLWGDVELESVHWVRPSAHLKRDADGLTNFDRLRKTLSERESNKEPPFKGNPVFRISDGDVTFEDALVETFNFETARGLDLTLTPTGDQSGTLEADVEMSFHFKDVGSRTEALHLDGELSEAAGLLAKAHFPKGLALPLDGSALVPGVRLDAVRVGLGTPGDERGMGSLELKYSLTGMVWTNSYPLLEDDKEPWLEQVVFGRTPEPANVVADVAFLDDFVGPGVELWTHGGVTTSQPVGMDDLQPAMSQTESYFERYDFEFESPDGATAIDAELVISNFGLGTHKGSVRATLTRAGEEEIEFSSRLANGEWTLGETGFALAMGDWKIHGTPGRMMLSGVFESDPEAAPTSFNLTFEGATWKPGRGLTRFGDGKRGSFIEDIVMAAGTAHGTLTTAETETTLSGKGYAHRVAANIGPSGLVARVYRFHQVEGPMFVEWKRVLTSDALDKVPIDYFVISYEGQQVFESFDVTLVTDEPYTDPGNYGYVVHKRMNLTARDAQGREAKLSLDAENIDIHNPLSALSSFQRSIAEKMAQPTVFDLNSTWGLQLPKELGFPEQHRGKCSTSCFVMR